MAQVIDSRQLIADMLAEPTVDAGPVTSQVTLEFTIKRFVLALLLDKAATVVPSRDVMPVLKCLQFHVTDTRLRVVATDLELSMICATEMITVAQPGTAVFPARKMLDILREADEGDVHVRVSAGTASITIGRTTWRLRLMGGDDYPPMPEIHEVTLTAVPRPAFLAALQSVRYAACRDANRASLMMIDIRGGRMTACDGARFQQAAITTLPFGCQIPIGAVDDLIKLLKASELADIHIGESAHHLIFRLGADVLIVAKMMAAWPDVEAQLLRPALENRHKLTIDRTTLIDAIKRVRIAADPETSALALILRDYTLTISARDKFDNFAEEVVDATWDGPDRTIVVNHAFLADLIGMSASPVITLHLGDDTKTRKAPIMIRDTDAGSVGVVQQMIADWVGA